MTDHVEPYVVAWRLAGKRVLVVGGGEIGEGKIETLLGTGARLVVVDPTPGVRVNELADQGRLVIHRRWFRPTDLAPRTELVVAATGDPDVNRRIAFWARKARVVVNAVDDPDRCDVTVPAVVARGPARIAITTSGATPAGARFMRELVSQRIPDEIGELLTEAAHARRALREDGTYRYDYTAWRERFFEPGLADVDRGRTGALRELRQRFVSGFDHARTPLSTGRISIVGAGPGGADLITRRGAARLAAADVVVYDRLVDPDLLDLAPVAAKRIPVGKGKGFGTDQNRIDDLIVEHARTGSHVVRLKGGDPVVFARLREELDATLLAGIPVEVVPGISSAVGAAALAGIPLTERGGASSFTVTTGHRDGVDAEAVETDGTIVVLMGATTAGAVGRRLLDAGRAPTEPVVFVHAAGRADQAVARSDLAEMAERGCPFPAPTVIVIGEVGRRVGAGEVSAELDRVA